MTLKTFASLFTGGGGCDIGAMQAGLTPIWGIEYDPDIAAVAASNLNHRIVVADILECDPHDFERVDVLHASPPCPNFSTAKTGAEETEQDIALAHKVAAFYTVLQPRIATLENVYGYRKSESFRIIVQALHDAGYHVRWWHLNAADYAVPQTRKRLILIASRDFIPQRPPATHRDPSTITEGQMSLFGQSLPSWIGWYEAIEDLIPQLPDSQFANWQMERLPDELRTMLLSQGISHDHHGEDYGKASGREQEEASFTITGNSNMTGARAVIVGGANTSQEQAAPGVGVSEEKEPARNVNASNARAWRAFIAPAVNGDGTAHNRDKEQRTHTVQATSYKQMPRAFILSNAKTEWGDGQVNECDPASSVTPQQGGRLRAFVVDGVHCGMRDGEEPSSTVVSDSGSGTVAQRAFIITDKDCGNCGALLANHDGADHCPNCGADAAGYLEQPRAFIVSSHSVDGGESATRDEDGPAMTVDTKTGRMRAFIFPGSNPSSGENPERYSEEPTHTIRAGRTDNLGSRAFIVPGGNANSFGHREDGEPARMAESVNRSGNTPRAFVVDGDNAGKEGPIHRGDKRPLGTVNNSSAPRAHVSGRVVQMTPRALARFQTFPDWYSLPESKTLSCRLIGNAVPCLMYQRILEAYL